VPGWEPQPLESLADLKIATAWIDRADPLVADRVRAAAARFPHATPIDFPLPDAAENALFMREVADVHRALFPEHSEEYDERVRTKIERCLEVGDGEAANAQRLRDLYREECAEAMEPFDLLLTPTTAFVAPPATVDEREIRRDGIRFTYPFDAVGWPALALPCGAAEDGLPASVQLAAPQDADARVLAAGELLASLI
jgi:Asp-tRNA(Asn)/Glu-tRNA(Gln) amidotransferase A subunit family amidase